MDTAQLILFVQLKTQTCTMKVAFFVSKYNKNQRIYPSKRISYFPTVYTRRFRLFSLVAKFLVEAPTTKDRLRENHINLFNMNFMPQ